jgi:hypothetical protein
MLTPDAPPEYKDLPKIWRNSELQRGLTMNFDTAQLAAAARHVATFLGGLATMLGIIHWLTPEQAAQIGVGLGKIADGLGNILLAIGPIIGLVSAFFAQRSATPAKQANSLLSSGAAHTIVGTPELAEAVNSPQVIVASGYAPEGHTQAHV